MGKGTISYMSEMRGKFMVPGLMKKSRSNIVTLPEWCFYVLGEVSGQWGKDGV